MKIKSILAASILLTSLGTQAYTCFEQIEVIEPVTQLRQTGLFTNEQAKTYARNQGIPLAYQGVWNSTVDIVWRDLRVGKTENEKHRLASEFSSEFQMKCLMSLYGL